MKIKIISWNVRGVNDPDKRKVIKNFLRSYRADIVCLQEIKVQEMSVKLVRGLGAGRNLNCKELNAEGSAGGILLLWDNSHINLADYVFGSYSVTCLFRMTENGFLWAFSGVYGPVENSYRESFWEELGSIKGLWDCPWCVGGDFNEVLYPNERSRGGRLTNSMRRFSEILNDLELRDLPLQGGPYTWSGGLNGSARSRLDRFLVNANWESHCNKVTQRRLPRPVSDRFPILLDSDGVRTGPAPFRFELMWLKYEGFKDILNGWWQNLHFYGSFSYILSAKLKALKGILKVWNSRTEMFLEKSRIIRRMLCEGSPFGTIARRTGVWTSRKLRNVLKPELTSKVGPLWKRSPGVRNRERLGLRKGTGIPVFFRGWLMPTGAEIV